MVGNRYGNVYGGSSIILELGHTLATSTTKKKEKRKVLSFCLGVPSMP